VADPPADLAIRLWQEAFDPLANLMAWQAGLRSEALHAAAEAHFIGRVRGITADGAPLEALELEHYPGMTELQLERLTADCALRHGLAAVRVDHRVGRIAAGEAIVLVAVRADRRGPAQRALMELLEAIKREAPFWKREWRTGGGGRWVTNTPLHGS
jgi:molybdopterin synthase catalytic subunit